MKFIDRGIELTYYYYEIILVVIAVIGFFVIDEVERKRGSKLNIVLRLSPYLVFIGIILARILYAFMPQLKTSFGGSMITIYYYALVIITGAILAAVMASFESKRRGLNPDTIWDMLPWILIAGIIGARLWHVLTPSADILVNGRNPYFIAPLEIFNFRKGGLGIPGGVMFGIIALLIYTRKKGLHFLTWADIIVPGVALAQGIGRWGNFFNQEIYGLPTKITQFPISVFIDAQGGYFLATFFYEFVWNLLNMALLLWLPRKLGDKMKPGDNLLVYAIFYAVGRFFLEYIRYVDSPILGQNSNQIVMAIIAILSAGILIFRHLKKSTAEAIPVKEPADLEK